MVANKKKTRPLTERQEQFAINMYTIGSDTFGNATESARKAGYSGNDNTLSQTGIKLVRNGRIKARKAELQAETAKQAEWTRQDAIDTLTKAKTLAIESGNVKDIVAVSRELSAISGHHNHVIQTKDVSAPAISEEERARLDLIARNYNKGIA